VSIDVYPETRWEGALRRARLGEVLVELGILTPGDVELAVSVQQRGGAQRLGTILSDLGLVTADDLARALAVVHQLPVVELGLVDIDFETARCVPRSLAERACLLPYERDGLRLRVAVSDPVDIVALDDIRALTGMSALDVHVGTASSIRSAIQAAWSVKEDADTVRDFVHQVGTDDLEEDEIDPSAEAATIRMVAQLLTVAVREGASDVHVEPGRSGVRIRMRVDGVLRVTMTLPRAGYSSLVARLKIVTGLDVIERRLPQDGRARVRVGSDLVDIRISTLPSLHGEKVVVRLLPPASRLPSLEALGFAPPHRQLLLDVSARPQGLILLTGPTGSGKTNTLYATIAEGITSQRNVMTLEDPVEIELPGITQVPIDERSGMDFPRGLRAILRQDPDVVLVGEIRDQITAELTVRAALTGHLVLSTLHTLDAAAAITRLTDMGLPPYLVTSCLSLVVSQRLVRVPCAGCTEREALDAEVARRLGITDTTGSWTTAVGCPACHGTGYHGRTAIVELLQIGPEIRAALLRGADEDTVRTAARRSGTKSLMDHAVSVARRGGTTIAELLRAIPIEESPAR
jgi:type IV pilus assembly protein PilB